MSSLCDVASGHLPHQGWRINSFRESLATSPDLGSQYNHIIVCRHFRMLMAHDHEFSTTKHGQVHFGGEIGGRERGGGFE